MSNTNDNVERMTKELGRTRSALNRDATITLVVAVILFSVFLAYFIYGYTQFKEVTKPKELMDTAETLVSDNLRTLRQNLQSEVRNNADSWAEQLSEEAIKTVPKMREQLEEFVSTQIDERVKQSIEITDPEFEKLITENNESLKKAFKDLAENKDVSKDLIEVITKEIDQRLKADVQADANIVLNNMRLLKAKIRRLKGGGDLSDEEKLERDILMTARLIQEKQVDQ